MYDIAAAAGLVQRLEQFSQDVPASDTLSIIWATWKSLCDVVKPSEAIRSLSERAQSIVVTAHVRFSRSSQSFDRLTTCDWELTLGDLQEIFSCSTLISRTFIDYLARLAEHSSTLPWNTVFTALQQARDGRKITGKPFLRGVNLSRQWAPVDIVNAAEELGLDVHFIKHGNKRKRGIQANTAALVNPARGTPVASNVSRVKSHSGEKDDEVVMVMSSPVNERKRRRRNALSPRRSMSVELPRRVPEPQDDYESPNSDNDCFLHYSPRSEAHDGPDVYESDDGTHHEDVSVGEHDLTLGSQSEEEEEEGEDHGHGKHEVTYARGRPTQMTIPTLDPILEESTFQFDDLGGDSAPSERPVPGPRTPPPAAFDDDKHIQNSNVTPNRPGLPDHYIDHELRLATAKTGDISAEPKPSTLSTTNTAECNAINQHHFQTKSSVNSLSTRGIEHAARRSQDSATNEQDPDLPTSVNSVQDTLERLRGTRDGGWLSHADFAVVLALILPSGFRYFEAPDCNPSFDWEKWSSTSRCRDSDPKQTVFSIVFDCARKHWVLLAFDFAHHLVQEYDSMYTGSTSMALPAQHIAARLGASWRHEQWRHVCAQTPQQEDLSSCGIYALACIVHIVTDTIIPASLGAQLWRRAFAAMISDEPAPTLQPPPQSVISNHVDVPMAHLVRAQLSHIAASKSWASHLGNVSRVLSTLRRTLQQYGQDPASQSIHEEWQQLQLALPALQSLCDIENARAMKSKSVGAEPGPYNKTHTALLSQVSRLQSAIKGITRRKASLTVLDTRMNALLSADEQVSQRVQSEVQAEMEELLSVKAALNSLGDH